MAVEGCCVGPWRGVLGCGGTGELQRVVHCCERLWRDVEDAKDSAIRLQQGSF